MLELARESDWEGINRIGKQVADLHVAWRPDLFRSSDHCYPKAYFLEKIKAREIFAGRWNGELVGYVIFYIWETNGANSVPRKVMSIDDICVDEVFRGQGIGTQMMLEVRALAKAFGCTDIQLSVYPQNEAAVAFYQKCGFMIKSIDMQRKV